MKTTLTTVLLSRDLDGMLRFCLQHLERAATAAGLQALNITVLDNASRWPCPPDFSNTPPFHLQRFDQHPSFAVACNHGADTSRDEFLLFLNNDVLLDREALRSMLRAFADDPALVIAGSRMMFPDATIQHAGVVFGAGDTGPYHWQRQTPSAQVPRTLTQFQAVTGACLLIRRADFLRLNGFDVSYPFGLEDVDLCLRAGQNGGGIRCVQDTDSLHFESMTPGRSKLDVPSRALFMQRWKGRYAIDG